MLEPVGKVEMQLGIEPNGRIQKYFTNACYRRMDKYVPMRTGMLRRVVDIRTNSITYSSPYAHAQYVGYTGGPVRNYTTPGTGPYWEKKMLSAEREDLVHEIQEEVRKHG